MVREMMENRVTKLIIKEMTRKSTFLYRVMRFRNLEDYIKFNLYSLKNGSSKSFQFRNSGILITTELLFMIIIYTYSESFL